jgi:hypothetical protein
MKKTFLFVAFLFVFMLCANASAQVTPPPGAGDKDLRDTNIKGRSNELERIDREARKNSKNSKSKNEPEEDRLAVKFAEIKEDFETIQTAQASIVNAYTTSEKISYARIAEFAAEVNKKALRLKANLFPPLKDEKSKEKKDEKKEEKPLAEEKPISKGVRELIVDLDNAVGAVVSSPMFQNLRVIDPKVAEKTKSDLETVIKLSDALKIEAEKSNAGQK